MKIELWADIICPWCGLGDHRLTLALRHFEHANDLHALGISGAQPVETIVAALQRAWSETYSLQHDRRS